MTSYDILKELTEVDEKLLIKPRKFVSMRMNLLLCLIASNINSLLSERDFAMSIISYFIIFALLYGIVTWLINRKRTSSLTNEV